MRYNDRLLASSDGFTLLPITAYIPPTALDIRLARTTVAEVLPGIGVFTRNDMVRVVGVKYPNKSSTFYAVTRPVAYEMVTYRIPTSPEPQVTTLTP